MVNNNDKPIACITVLCDPKRIQRIGLTCKCTRRWTELIPAEVHDSALIVLFTCPQCGQEYILQNKQLTRQEDFNARRQGKATNCVVPFGEHIKFDA